MATKSDRLVVAIDGPAGAGKTTAGVWLARRLSLKLIDSGYFFRGLAAAAGRLNALNRLDVDAQVPPDDDWRPTLRFDGKLVDPRGAEIEDGLAAVVADPIVRVAVARRVDALAAPAGAVVVGRRTAIESCAAASVRVFMTAVDEVRVGRRREADRGSESTSMHLARLAAREPPLVENRSLYTITIDTSYLSVNDVRDLLMRHVANRSSP